MLRQATELEKFEVFATDGPVGRVRDFFFDDRRWIVRYFVVATGSCLNRAEVLISPVALCGPDWLQRFIPIALKREQVERSPALDSRLPVAREHESALVHHYNWPVYWGVAGFPEVDIPEDDASDDSPGVRKAGAGASDGLPAGVSAAKPVSPQGFHLRSVRAVTGHAIEATDGRVGDVADFLMDDLTWEIRYLLVDTCSWWPGKKVLIAPQWIERVGWGEAKVYVNLTREAIKGGPAYSPDQPVTPDYPGQLCRHPEVAERAGSPEETRS
jgi:hypothetical protein